jgi:hypothetical protein
MHRFQKPTLETSRPICYFLFDHLKEISANLRIPRCPELFVNFGRIQRLRFRVF